MFRSIYRVLLSIIVFSAGISLGTAAWGKTNSPWANNLPFKEGAIHYTITGSENGNQVTYVTDYGQTTASYRNSSIKVFGFSQSAYSSPFRTLIPFDSGHPFHFIPDSISI